MTDRELLDILLSHLDNQDICVYQKTHVEIQNGCHGDHIEFDFDEDGNITGIYC